MSDKVKHIDIKKCTYYFFNDIINLKSLIQIILQWMKSHKKIYFYLLYWISDDQNSKIHRHL